VSLPAARRHPCYSIVEILFCRKAVVSGHEITSLDSWGIETFYQYIKNRGDFNDLKFQDYYDEQGFAFIMLVTGQIHQAMIKAQRKLDDNTTSIFDLLLKARALKLEKRGNYWQLKNTRKKDLEILEKVGFIPQERIQA
jgi:hypothetical protein